MLCCTPRDARAGPQAHPGAPARLRPDLPASNSNLFFLRTRDKAPVAKLSYWETGAENKGSLRSAHARAGAEDRGPHARARNL